MSGDSSVLGFSNATPALFDPLPGHMINVYTNNATPASGAGVSFIPDLGRYPGGAEDAGITLTSDYHGVQINRPGMYQWYVTAVLTTTGSGDVTLTMADLTAPGVAPSTPIVKTATAGTPLTISTSGDAFKISKTSPPIQLIPTLAAAGGISALSTLYVAVARVA